MIHSPTLDSILMVEKTINKYKELGIYQLWKKLPRKMMYQTLQSIIKYLEKSGKISINGTRIKLMEKKPEISEEKEIPRYVT